MASLVSFCSLTGRRAAADKITKNLTAFLCVDTSEVPEFHLNAPLTDNILSMRKEEDRKDHPDQAAFDKEARGAKIKRRGAKEALEQLALRFGSSLWENVPKLKEGCEGALIKAFTASELSADIMDRENNFGQEIIDGLSTIRALLPKFHPDLHADVCFSTQRIFVF